MHERGTPKHGYPQVRAWLRRIEDELNMEHAA
jgi:hypothetical protein